MPKMKTVKAIQAKFRVSGTGKLRRHRPGLRHHLEQKSPKRKRHLKKSAGIGRAQEKMYSRLICV